MAWMYVSVLVKKLIPTLPPRRYGYICSNNFLRFSDFMYMLHYINGKKCMDDEISYEHVISIHRKLPHVCTYMHNYRATVFHSKICMKIMYLP
jgi:hypothetical protein